VSDGVLSATFSAISAAGVPGRDDAVVAQTLMLTPTGNPPRVARYSAAAPPVLRASATRAFLMPTARRERGLRHAVRKIAADD